MPRQTPLHPTLHPHPHLGRHKAAAARVRVVCNHDAPVCLLNLLFRGALPHAWHTARGQQRRINIVAASACVGARLTVGTPGSSARVQALACCKRAPMQGVSLLPRLGKYPCRPSFDHPTVNLPLGLGNAAAHEQQQAKPGRPAHRPAALTQNQRRLSPRHLRQEPPLVELPHARPRCLPRVHCLECRAPRVGRCAHCQPRQEWGRLQGGAGVVSLELRAWGCRWLRLAPPTPLRRSVMAWPGAHHAAWPRLLPARPCIRCTAASGAKVELSGLLVGVGGGKRRRVGGVCSQG